MKIYLNCYVEQDDLNLVYCTGDFDSVERTYDGGNGNHSVSLPIILIKIKVNQMLPFSNISSLLVSIFRFCI